MKRATCRSRALGRIARARRSPFEARGASAATSHQPRAHRLRTSSRAVRAERISLSLSPGELLVLLAIDGNGADTIARAIAGLEPFSGRVAVGGVTLPPSGDPLAFRAAGGAFVPADRREEGLVAALSLAENLALPNPPGRRLPRPRGDARSRRRAAEPHSASARLAGRPGRLALRREPAEARPRARAGAPLPAFSSPSIRRAASTSLPRPRSGAASSTPAAPGRPSSSSRPIPTRRSSSARRFASSTAAASRAPSSPRRPPRRSDG